MNKNFSYRSKLILGNQIAQLVAHGSLQTIKVDPISVIFRLSLLRIKNNISTTVKKNGKKNSTTQKFLNFLLLNVSVTSQIRKNGLFKISKLQTNVEGTRLTLLWVKNPT